MEDFLSPNSPQPDSMAAHEDDLFGVDITPKAESRQVKVEGTQQDEEMEDLFGDDEAAVEQAKAVCVMCTLPWMHEV